MSPKNTSTSKTPLWPINILSQAILNILNDIEKNNNKVRSKLRSFSQYSLNQTSAFETERTRDKLLNEKNVLLLKNNYEAKINELKKNLNVYIIVGLASRPGISTTLYLAGCAFTLSARKEKVLEISGGKSITEKARATNDEGDESPESPIRPKASTFVSADALEPVQRAPPVRRQTGPRVFIDNKEAGCVTDISSR